jgi:putative endonuclease
MPAKAGIQGNPRSIRHMQPCVYILASGRNGTLCVGVTNSIARRAWEHRSDLVDGFTKRYGVHRLIYAEFHATMPDAILCEKQIKKWRRAWKLRLIEENNRNGVTSTTIC